MACSPRCRGCRRYSTRSGRLVGATGPRTARSAETVILTTTTIASNGESTQRTRVRRRLPAYGRKVVALRESGQAPTVAVLVVDGWEPIANIEEYAPWVVVVPGDEQPDELDFGCLDGLFAFVFADRVERMDAIAVALLAYRPAGVFGWSSDLPALAY